MDNLPLLWKKSHTFNFAVKMNIVFLNLIGGISHLGLLNIVTFLETKGYKSKLVYLSRIPIIAKDENYAPLTEPEKESIISFIDQERPALIGFSLMTYNFHQATDNGVRFPPRCSTYTVTTPEHGTCSLLWHSWLWSWLSWYRCCVRTVWLCIGLQGCCSAFCRFVRAVRWIATCSLLPSARSD